MLISSFAVLAFQLQIIRLGKPYDECVDPATVNTSLNAYQDLFPDVGYRESVSIGHTIRPSEWSRYVNIAYSVKYCLLQIVCIIYFSVVFLWAFVFCFFVAPIRLFACRVVKFFLHFHISLSYICTSFVLLCFFVSFCKSLHTYVRLSFLSPLLIHSTMFIDIFILFHASTILRRKESTIYLLADRAF